VLGWQAQAGREIDSLFSDLTRKKKQKGGDSEATAKAPRQSADPPVAEKPRTNSVLDDLGGGWRCDLCWCC
jgi:hypothetical protein